MVKVRLPEGVGDGKTIRLKGKGGPGRSNGPAGDLYVRVHVDPDSTFGRDGDHLTVTVPATFADLALGADLRVPTIDGDSVTIRVPAGTPSGRTFRVRNRGVSTANGTGDLLATVEVIIPTELSEQERAAIESLRVAGAEAATATAGA